MRTEYEYAGQRAYASWTPSKGYDLDHWGEPHYLWVPPWRVQGGWMLGGTVLNPEWAGNVVLSEN